MIQTVRAFIKKELRQTLRDRRMRVLLFGAPLIQLTVFGLALSTEVKNIKLAVFSRPGDQAAVRMASDFFSSGWFVPVSKEGGTPFGLISSGRADAALIMPAEGAGSGGEAQLLIDASNANKARIIEAYALKITAAGSDAVSPVEIETRVLYNPEMKSAFFLVPGVTGMLICLITIILTAMSFARERETGTLEAISAAPVSRLEILLGKTIPFIILGMAAAALVLTASHLLFGVPVRGPLWQLGLVCAVFVVVSVSIGTLISTVAANQQQAMLGGFIFLFPAILLSGIMFPVENMPAAIKPAAYLNPLMYFLRLLRSIMLKGGGRLWADLLPMSAIGILAAAAILKGKLKSSI